jgi:hypothetical protein
MSDAIAPLPFRWDGEAFRPENQHWAKRADAAYTIGQTYILAPHEDRSQKSHSHQFAEIAEAWKHLPEGWSRRLPTPEHLRKFCLIKAGYADSRTFVAASEKQARDLVRFLRPSDEFSLVTADAATVTVWMAQSQSRRAMGNARFQESKQAILEIAAEMIDVAPATLTRETGRAA